MVGEPAGQVDLPDGGSRPVDDGSRQHGADANLLADTNQCDVHAGRVDVGQLGQVADSHHHLRIRESSTGFEVAAEGGGKAEADRLQDRVHSETDTVPVQVLDRLIQTFKGANLIRNDDDLGPPVPGVLAV